MDVELQSIFQNKSKIIENYYPEFSIPKGINLEDKGYALKFLKILLQRNPKDRLKIKNLGKTNLFKIRIKNESPEHFQKSSQAVYNFIHRNVYLDAIKKFYVRKVMTHKEKQEYIQIMRCFDLDDGGYLDKDEFVKGIMRSSPEISKQKAL